MVVLALSLWGQICTTMSPSARVLFAIDVLFQGQALPFLFVVSPKSQAT